MGQGCLIVSKRTCGVAIAPTVYGGGGGGGTGAENAHAGIATRLNLPGGCQVIGLIPVCPQGSPALVAD